MATKKTFNPSALLQLVQDLIAAAPQEAVVLGPVFVDLLALFGKTPASPVMTGEAKCCHEGVCCCLHEALKAQTMALGQTVKALTCCEDPTPNPDPVPSDSGS